ncbi:MAG TPA: hypothetical protein VFD36_20710 [Kofleriaceae bacterium]|nr:hypothetical protein [Kofleriaceae bacterium]
MSPLRPEDVVDKKRDRMPKEVIAAFDELIAEKWDGREAVIPQPEVIERIKQKLVTLSGDDVIGRGYLDIEPIYEKVGWKVEYDKPAFNEAGTATFTFTKRRRRSR